MENDKFDFNVLLGGPDIFFVGSGTHQLRARKGGAEPLNGFIYTINPDETGNHVQLFNPSKGHLNVERDFIDLMFPEDKRDKVRDLDADPYAPRTLRNMAMEEGNIYGRLGWLRGKDRVTYPVVWVWNLPANSRTALREIAKSVDFPMDTTQLVHNQEELGSLEDFLAGEKADEEKPEDVDLARLHLATGLEKKALQQELGKTAEKWAELGRRTEVSPEERKASDIEDTTPKGSIGQYRQFSKDPYFLRYGESFKEFFDDSEKKS